MNGGSGLLPVRKKCVGERITDPFRVEARTHRFDFSKKEEWALIDRSSGHNAMGYNTFGFRIGISKSGIVRLRAGWKRAYPNLRTQVPGRGALTMWRAKKG
ncbi:unnamed protein product (mitochondrion) [Musa textilis]